MSKEFWAGLCLSMLVAAQIQLFITFIVAYLNNFEVLVQINEFGEAHIEMVLMIIITFICLPYSVYYYILQRKHLSC